MRFYIDVTPLMRDAVGRVALARFSALGEARSSVVFGKLLSDARLAPRGGSRLRSVRRAVAVLVGSGIPARVLAVLRAPEAARERYVREIEAATRVELAPDTPLVARLDAIERLLWTAPPVMFPRLIGIIASGMLSYLAVTRLLGGRARPDELQTLTRGLEHNPTTEMDMALWALTAQVRRDAGARRVVLEWTPTELAAAYRAGALPAGLQEGLAAFLARYGFRSVGEIDLGVARWGRIRRTCWGRSRTICDWGTRRRRRTRSSRGGGARRRRWGRRCWAG